MYKKCSFHGLTRNGETVLYTFLASGRSRNPTAYRKNSSLRQYLTASSCHHYAIADYRDFQKLLAFVQELTFRFQLKISRKYKWIITVVWRLWILKILTDFLSYFWLDNRSLENISYIKMMLIHLTGSLNNILKCIPRKIRNTLQDEKFSHQKFQWKLWMLCIFSMFCFRN